MKYDYISRLEKGLKGKNFIIYAKETFQGRFPEEINVDVFIKLNKNEEELLKLKYFAGRKPFLRKWIELFNINKIFYNSEFENLFLKFISEEIKEGEKIFIEYVNDTETYNFLFRGYPVYVSRLGYKLLNLGFTWFKDFYVPEGFWEGSPKIIAEKAINEKRKIEHISYIKKEILNFLEKYKNSKDELLLKGIKRAEEFLSYFD